MASIHSSKNPPSKGIVGDAYYSSAERGVYICIPGGSLVPLAGLLSTNPGGAVGPQGERGLMGPVGPQGSQGERGERGTDGKDGQPGAQGERGAAGLPGPAGRDGKDGRDGENSIVPGPQGLQGLQGERGARGPRGDILIPNDSELAAAVTALRAAQAKAKAALLTAIEDSGNLKSAAARIHVRSTLEQLKRDSGL